MITVKGNKNIAKAVRDTIREAIPATPAKEVQVVPVVSAHNEPLIIEVKDVKGNVLGTLNADYRTFSTGSKGYYVSGKIPGQGVDRLQVSGNMVIIGSKNH